MKTHARFFNEDLFHAELAEGYERPFLFKRPKFKCWMETREGSDGVEECFHFRDEDGNMWRPTKREYFSDGASVPYPLALVPPFTPYRYKAPAMGIHDPACRFGKLEKRNPETKLWDVVDVPRTQADELLRQAVKAKGAYRATQSGYWAGVRIGAGFGMVGDFFKSLFGHGGHTERK